MSNLVKLEHSKKKLSENCKHYHSSNPFFFAKKLKELVISLEKKDNKAFKTLPGRCINLVNDVFNDTLSQVNYIPVKVKKSKVAILKKEKLIIFF